MSCPLWSFPNVFVIQSIVVKDVSELSNLDSGTAAAALRSLEQMQEHLSAVVNFNKRGKWLIVQSNDYDSNARIHQSWLCNICFYYKTSLLLNWCHTTADVDMTTIHCGLKMFLSRYFICNVHSYRLTLFSFYFKASSWNLIDNRDWNTLHCW